MNNITFTSIDDFDKLHVVRRLREVIGHWWKIQLNFTDEKGYLRGVPKGKFFNPVNPVSQRITENNETFKECLANVRKANGIARGVDSHLLATDPAGFSTLIVPLRVGGTYYGCLFADGFILESSAAEQKENIRAYLKTHFPSEANGLEKHFTQLPVLSLKDVQYLKELLDIVVAEILILRHTLNEMEERVSQLTENMGERWKFDNILGKSDAMRSVFQIVERVMESDSTILITGENGTGKEGIARAIHFHSRRKDKPFVVQNCGALNDNLLDSELFGHVKGSFTNAVRDKKGLFQLADKGTLFLDEIGDTSPAMQVKLLRVLQEGSFVPVGGSDEKKVDVRVLAATNKNLEQMVKDGTFREDLYYRLNVINVKLPALRDRKEDIPILIQKFLEDYSAQHKRPLQKLSAMCVLLLEKYQWPGNVRELKNEVERLCVLAGKDEMISHELLSEKILQSHEKTDYALFPGEEKVDFESSTLKGTLEVVEKKMILAALESNQWNKSKAAKKLGMSRASLIMKCEKYGFAKGDGREDEDLSKRPIPLLRKSS